MGPNEFGNHFVLEFVLGTMEMHWMLASFIRKVFSPCDYWSQAFMINKIPIFFITNVISVTSIYPMHSFLVSTLCRLILGMKAFKCNCCGFGLFLHLVYLYDICDEFAKNLYFNWYYFFVILAYLKASSLSLVPLVICVMSLIFLKFIYIQ